MWEKVADTVCISGTKGKTHSLFENVHINFKIGASLDIRKVFFTNKLLLHTMENFQKDLQTFQKVKELITNLPEVQ